MDAASFEVQRGEVAQPAQALLDAVGADRAVGVAPAGGAVAQIKLLQERAERGDALEDDVVDEAEVGEGER